VRLADNCNDVPQWLEENKDFEPEILLVQEREE
jgi:hypothetical protein